MPCILKKPTHKSPGVMTFTHNEALSGLPAHDAQVQDFLKQSVVAKKWLFGVHIQGDCHHLSQWPKQDWQSFWLWPNKKADFLRKLPSEDVLDMNCINFMSESLFPASQNRHIDICVISRATHLKRISFTLTLIKALLQARPMLNIALVIPDQRTVDGQTNPYDDTAIDKRFYAWPKKLFTAKELKQISFLSGMTQDFGRHPIAMPMLHMILGRSRFLMLNSHLEGTPRVIAEAFLMDTPVIVSQNLRTGIQHWLDDKNTCFIEDKVLPARDKIIQALDNPKQYQVNLAQMRQRCLAPLNKAKLKAWLMQKIEAMGCPVEGAWALDDLGHRLACHGEKKNYQMVDNPVQFFDWLNNSLAGDVYDEDMTLGLETMSFEEALTTLMEDSPAESWVRKTARSVKAQLRRGRKHDKSV